MKKYWAIGVGLILLGGAFFLRSTVISPESSLPSAPKPKPEMITDSAGPGSDHARLTGRITLAIGGAPVAGAILNARSETGQEYTAHANAVGRFEFSYMLPGRYQFWGRPYPDIGRQELSENLSLEAGSTIHHDFVIPGGPMLSGKVTTWDKKPLNEIRIDIYSAGKERHFEMRMVRPKEFPSFIYYVQKARGPTEIVVRAEGYIPSKPLPIEIRDENLKGLEFFLGQGGSQGGVVLNEDRDPVPNATIYLAPKSYPDIPGQKTITVADGRFDFKEIPASEYTPSVQAKGYVVETVKPDRITITTGVRNPDVTFRVRRGWSISGIVVDEQQKPVGQAKITVKEGTRSAWDVSKKDGTFLVSGIIPDDPEQQAEKGIDSLMCRRSGFPTLRLRNVSPGADLRLVLARPGALAVSIQLSDRPVLAADFPWSIWLLGEQETDQRSGVSIRRTWQVTPCKGKTGIRDRLTPGIYKLVVRAGGRQPYEVSRVEIHPGQTTTIEATLVPGGEGDIGAVSLKLNSAAELRIQLDRLLKELPPKDRTAILDRLRTQADTYPEGAKRRIIIEETLKGLDYKRPSDK